MNFTHIKNGSDKLLVIFCGWGSDANLFGSFDYGKSDVLICSGYDALDFDVSLLQAYESRSLFAWSLGVWAAGKCLDSALFGRTAAFGGTPFPIDDNFGIATAVFDGTIANFSERSLDKFRRRMCGTEYSDFIGYLPATSAVTLLAELKSIRAAAASVSDCAFRWDRAYCPAEDKIFTPTNQVAAWESLGVPCITLGKNHFCRQAMQQILDTL